MGTCECCQYFSASSERNVDGIVGGICRRYPPRPLVLPQVNSLTQQVMMTVQSAFSETTNVQYCGEYLVKAANDSNILSSN